MRTCMLSLGLGLAILVAWPADSSRAQRRGASAQLVWMGASADKVQQGKTVRPDGKIDGRFRLSLKTNKQRRIVHVLLRSCDQRGVLTGRVAWDTDRTRLWVVGVFRRGQPLRLGKGRTIDRFKGDRRYDLYVSKPLGGFKPGQSFCAYVTFGDGMGVSARAAITVPVRAGLSYSGRNRDRVGRKRRPFPDGVNDAHFVLRMDSGGRTARLRRVSLVRVDRRGRPMARQQWTTDKKSGWVLGVERGRKRLNRTDRAIRDNFTGMAEYHLYASPRGPLVGGERFRATAYFSNGSPSVAMVTIPHQKQAKATLAYVGLTQDRLGPRSPSGPDGKKDGHFRLTVSGEGQQITGLVLRAVWPGGQAVQNQIWDTRPRGYRMIAVYRNGKRLNPKDRGLKRQKLSGTVAYDLFIHNTGWVRPLQNFRVEVVFANGNRASASAKVLDKPAAAGKLKAKLRYHGFLADKVGRWSQAGPDGKHDAKFTLQVDTGGRAITINKFELSVSDAKGKTWRKTWDTQPGGNWILGVEKNGKRLNTTDRKLRDRLTGRATYTLWASHDSYKWRGKNYTYFAKGGYFTARLYLSGNRVIVRTIRLHR